MSLRLGPLPESSSTGVFRMGGQGIERREVLRFIGIASVAAAFPGFRQWAFACSHSPIASSNLEVAEQSYKPLFFSDSQYRLIEHLADMIIPTDDSPGAKEAGVAEFIDFMVANRVPVSGRSSMSQDTALSIGSEVQVQWIEGLNWMNAQSRYEFGKEFLDCTSEQQVGFLEVLAFKSKFKPATETGREFFQMMRDYTVAGYYTTRIGLESLGYAGLRTVWPNAPGCTHPDDPTHARLSNNTGSLVALNILK